MPPLATYSLPADKLEEAADRLLACADRVIGPVRTPPGDLFFDVVRSVNEIELQYGNSLLPPTTALFPMAEEIFSVVGGTPPVIRAPRSDASCLLFGIRPCDVAAIQRLDHFFLDGEFKDDLYAARRSRTAIVAVACSQKADARCFCSCCDTGPFAKTGYDLQLSLVDDTYLVEVGTEQGRRLAQRLSDLLGAADDDLILERERRAQELFTELEQKGNMPSAIRRITGEAVSQAVWERIGGRCMGCGGCSFVCPVCSCFYVIDQTLPDGTVQRIRAQDSCRLAGYTREASGHNPRALPSQRAARYSYHKLSYRYIEREGTQGCVGCGRCVTVCLGGVHMPAVTEMIRREA